MMYAMNDWMPFGRFMVPVHPLLVALVSAAVVAHGGSLLAYAFAAGFGAGFVEGVNYRRQVALPGGTIPRVELGKAVRVAHRTPDHDPLPGWL